MADLAQHPGEHRRLDLLDRAADLAEAETEEAPADEAAADEPAEAPEA